MKTKIAAVLVAVCLAHTAWAQDNAARTRANRDAAFIAYDQKSIAITHVQVVDGTGAAPKPDMTVVITNGRLAAVGPSRRTPAPKDAFVIDGKGKTVLPGFVMMHEHLHYPSPSRGFISYAKEFSQLYLAAGETTIRTAGTVNPYADLIVKRAIDEGKQIGPDIDSTGPYIDGRVSHTGPLIKTPEDAKIVVDYWAHEGSTSFKAYEYVTRDEMAAAVKAAHAHGLKVTGHICSVTYRDAIGVGMDNLEHSFEEMSDFVPGKKLDECPSWPARLQSILKLDPNGPEIGDMIALMLAHHVALTSTLTINEVMSPGRPLPPESVLSLLSPAVRQYQEPSIERVRKGGLGKLLGQLLPNLIKMELRFFHAGGLLMTGSDPTGNGLTLPTYTSVRQLQLMVEGGFTFPEAVEAQTLNGARYLGRDAEIGSVAAGKRADLVLIDGDPVADINTLARIETVFKNGVGYSHQAIVDAYKGRIDID